MSKNYSTDSNQHFKQDIILDQIESGKYTLRLKSKVNIELLITVCDLNLQTNKSNSNCVSFGAEFKGTQNNVSLVGDYNMDS